MGRIYKRRVGNRNYANYSEDTLKNAVAAIRAGASYREAGIRYGIPWKTLWNKVKGKHKNKVGGPTALTEVEERVLVDVLLAAGEFGSPLTAFDLRLLVKRYFDRKGTIISKFPNNLPGHDWVLNFMDRHKDKLSQRSCQNIKTCRAEKTEEEMQNYFENLERSLRDVPPTNILNFDETNLSDDPGSKKCIFRRRMKYPERVMNTSKACISIMFAITEAGDVLPPYTVYKAERLYDQWTIGGPKNARYNRSKSGWFDGFTFEDWFSSIVIPWAKRLSGPKVIIGDNLSSHLNIEIIIECQRNNVRFVFLPKNATHITQPLDVGYYGPLKKIWRKLLTDYKTQNPRDQTLNKSTFPHLLKKLMDKLDLTNKTTIEGVFRGTYSNRAQEHISETLSESLLDYLKEFRTPQSNIKPRSRKKMLKIQPGKSVSYEDFCSDEENAAEAVEGVAEDEEEKENIPNIDLTDVDVSDEELPIPKPGIFTVIKLASKKSFKHFICKIEEVNRPELVVKFMRVKRENLFVFPDKDDISVQNEDDIVMYLKPPSMKRGIYTFDGLNTTEYKF